MLHANQLLPSAHLTELFSPLMKDEKAVLNIIEKISDIDFYRGIELGIIKSTVITNRIRDIIYKNKLMVTQRMTFELLAENLNLANTDHTIRTKSIKKTKKLVYIAAESGTTELSMVRGADPQLEWVDETKHCLTESIISISQEAIQYKKMNLQIEPLDHYAHKKQLIDFTGETVDWIMHMRPECPNLYLASFNAHVSLNEEDLRESLKLAAPVISQIHLANAILDRQDPHYGD